MMLERQIQPDPPASSDVGSSSGAGSPAGSESQTPAQQQEALLDKLQSEGDRVAGAQSTGQQGGAHR